MCEMSISLSRGEDSLLHQEINQIMVYAQPSQVWATWVLVHPCRGSF